MLWTICKPGTTDHGGGFSVHAEMHIGANDKAGQERLLRYCARPISAGERLSRVKQGERLRYRLSKPGRTVRANLFSVLMSCLIASPRGSHRREGIGIATLACLRQTHLCARQSPPGRACRLTATFPQKRSKSRQRPTKRTKAKRPATRCSQSGPC